DVYAGDVERYYAHDRAAHIEQWLAAQRWPKVTRYVVLDDAPCAFKDETRVVRCNPDVGSPLPTWRGCAACCDSRPRPNEDSQTPPPMVTQRKRLAPATVRLKLRPHATAGLP
ncbi:MAG TPA: hypothetical protein VFA81_01835, partial [Burkholderiales bacterium]|nr:hypothetical protein [Burkholderiales bacterium]